MPPEVKNKRRAADDDITSVWEVTNKHEDGRVDRLVGLCMVLPVGTNGDDENAALGNMPTYGCEGFVPTSGNNRRFDVVGRSWRRSGHHGWFHDRRSPDSHHNVDGLPVFSLGFVISSDGVNYHFSTKEYSVRATYLAPVCLTPALLRRLRSWWLVTVGRKARWEQEMLPLTTIFCMLENGCRARIRTSDSESQAVSVGQSTEFGDDVEAVFVFFFSRVGSKGRASNP